MSNDGDAPLLSICIPTYNRASSLSELLKKLCEVKERFEDDVEICISDNCSDDNTASILNSYRLRLGLNTKRQITNLGGTLNIISVSQMMSGHWGILLGDDDSLDLDGLEELMCLLRRSEDNTWIFAEARDLERKRLYFSGFLKSKYSSREFLQQIFSSGLDGFGFMGVHVFPRKAVTIFDSLTIENSQPWPHMAAMLRALTYNNFSVSILHRAVIFQAGEGFHLFWAVGDMAQMRLRKILILENTLKLVRKNRYFLRLIMFRELYSVENLKYLIKWKVLENFDFNESSHAAYLSVYKRFGLFVPLVLPHYGMFLTIYFLPRSCINWILSMMGKRDLNLDYQKLKNNLGKHDGIKRGI